MVAFFKVSQTREKTFEPSGFLLDTIRHLGDECFCSTCFAAEKLRTTGCSLCEVKMRLLFRVLLSFCCFSKIYWSSNSITLSQIQTFILTISILWFLNVVFVRDRRQISRLIISVVKWIEQLQVHLKLW